MKCCVVGGDIRALPGQVAELVEIGCSTITSGSCSSVAADVMSAPCNPVPHLWEYRRLVVFPIGIALMEVTLASPVSVFGSGQSCRHSFIVGIPGLVFAMCGSNISCSCPTLAFFLGSTCASITP